jgi:hypothetical protein
MEFENKLIEIQRFVIGLCQRNKYSLKVKLAMQTKLQLFQHALQLCHKFQRGKTSGNENHRLQKVMLLLCCV